VDRLSRRRVMVAADLGRAGIAVALVVLRHHLWAVYGAAFGLSTLAVFSTRQPPAPYRPWWPTMRG
jgi:hypothetical protein